jgi:hypothetical protein
MAGTLHQMAAHIKPAGGAAALVFEARRGSD